MWSLRFPREIANPRRKVCETKQDYLDYIKHAIRLTDLYTTVYNYTEFFDRKYYIKPNYESAIVDRLYFDCDFKIRNEETDGYVSMLKLHEWCKSNGNIKHQCYFTGSAYSVILSATHNGLQNKAGTVYNAQQHIIEDLDILTDPQVMGDISRITRVPNTFNFKETARRYAIPLKESQLYDGDDTLRLLAEKQQFGVKPIGTGSFDISEFDCAPQRRVNIDIMDAAAEGVPENVQEILDRFELIPDCIKRMMADTQLGYSGRRMLILWLRDQGLLLEEVMGILKECLSARKYKHAVYEEKQPQYLYSRMMDMYFPKCSTIFAEGYCDCTAEDECGLR